MDWIVISVEFCKLFVDWKVVGCVSKDVDDVLWCCFKVVQDFFFMVCNVVIVEKEVEL